MNITRELEEDILKLGLSGDLNTQTAPELEKEIEDLTGITEVFFDLEDLNYISSAGLRVLMKCQKAMNKQNGKMIIQNANELVKEVFHMTGLQDMFTIL